MKTIFKVYSYGWLNILFMGDIQKQILQENGIRLLI